MSVLGSSDHDDRLRLESAEDRLRALMLGGAAADWGSAPLVSVGMGSNASDVGGLSGPGDGSGAGASGGGVGSSASALAWGTGLW